MSRIRAIETVTDIPLVIRGGSGVPIAQHYAHAIKCVQIALGN
jgi:fructose/tagatose bisphosphate aldolase